MKKKLLITVIMILYLYGCQERKNNGVFYCQVENKIEEYPDSSFFSNITLIMVSYMFWIINEEILLN